VRVPKPAVLAFANQYIDIQLAYWFCVLHPTILLTMVSHSCYSSSAPGVDQGVVSATRRGHSAADLEARLCACVLGIFTYAA
jgi:hypothetical protein